MSAEVINVMQEQIRAAAADGRALAIHGGGSKAFCLPVISGDPLDTRPLRGIVDYEPSELVVTVRAGTPLNELQQILAAEGQMLGFEPPAYSNAATVGGTTACGLSGPRRPYAGSLRDFVLGVRCLNGKAEDMRFGGQVMKNVAGYDVARLMAGAQGSLGVLLEISFKVLPLPETEATVSQPLSQTEAMTTMNRLAGQPLPLSAAAHVDGCLYLRFSGSSAAVDAAVASLNLPRLPQHAEFWTALREQQHAFFQSDRPLWRLSLPSTAAMPELPATAQDWLLDWGGAQRWLKSTASAETIQVAAKASGGYASLYRGSGQQRLPELPAPLLRLQRRLRAAFDPGHIFNREVLYGGAA